MANVPSFVSRAHPQTTAPAAASPAEVARFYIPGHPQPHTDGLIAS